MELTNIRFLFLATHKTYRQARSLECVSLLILFLAAIFIIPGDW
jgi:hypothetical protein